MVIASPEMQNYFESLKSQVKEEFDLASKARKMNLDAADFVEIRLAENMAERVVGLT